MKLTLLIPDISELDYVKEQSGSFAGVCYMNKPFENIAMDIDKCKNRFEDTKAKGHHSVAEHNHLTLLIEDSSKLFAMILNSVRAYNTSEKSGRYTKIGAEDENYTKWYNIIKSYLIEKGVDENTANRTASENARMQLSILHQGTTFVYTTSYRMLGYLAYYCEDLAIKLDNTELQDTVLIDELECFAHYIKKALGIDYKNNKPSEIDFIIDACSEPKRKMLLNSFASIGGIAYNYAFDISFTGAAQFERHRTLKYNMYIGKQEKDVLNDKTLNYLAEKSREEWREACPYYIPSVITEMGKEEAWVSDMQEVKLPQGMKVALIERGTVEDLVLKAQERICTRAQEEVRNLTIKQLKSIYENGTVYVKEYLEGCGAIKLMAEGKGYRCATKCEMLKCTETCDKIKDFITELSK